jgi:hypothetical protein
VQDVDFFNAAMGRMIQVDVFKRLQRLRLGKLLGMEDSISLEGDLGSVLFPCVFR